MKKVGRDSKQLVLVRETVIGLRPDSLQTVVGGANAAAGSLIKVCILGSAVRVCAF